MLSIIKYYDSTTSKNHEAIRECFKEIKNINLKEVIDSGSFGTVYLASGQIDLLEPINLVNVGGSKTDFKRNPICFKVNKDITIAIKKTFIEENELKNMYFETDLYKFMSDVNIAPKFYNSFFKPSGEQDINNKHKKKYTQYLFTEVMDMNCYNALNSDNIEKKIKYKIINEMINLLYFQIFNYNLFCSDVKPPNFLFSNKKSEISLLFEDSYHSKLDTISVKMIDFGGDYCNFEKEDLKNEFFLAMVIQITLFLPKNLRKIIFHNKKFKKIKKNIKDFNFYILNEKKHLFALQTYVNNTFKKNVNIIYVLINILNANYIKFINFWEDKNNLCPEFQLTYSKPIENLFINQIDITIRMYNLLIGWMSDVYKKFKFSEQSYKKSINYLNLFLAHNKELSRKKFQLLGCVCMYIGFNYEVEKEDYIYISNNNFNSQNFDEMYIKVINLFENIKE